MGMREKDQADFDLEQFVDLFDTAMTSDNPTVKRAFKNLLMVAAIANAEETFDGLRKGPLRRLVEDVRALNQRLGNLEGAGAFRTPYTNGKPYTGGSGPSVTPYYGPAMTPVPGMIPPGAVWTSTNTATPTSTTLASNSATASVLNNLEQKYES